MFRVCLGEGVGAAKNRAGEQASKGSPGLTTTPWSSLTRQDGCTYWDDFQKLTALLMIEISGNGALLVSILCVVGVCAHALKSQWAACMNLVQAWWAGEQQQELKKNTDAENLVVLSVSIMVKWLGFIWGKMKGLSWQKMYWNCKHSAEWLRLTESGGIWYYKTYLRRKNQVIQHLWHFASYYSIDTPLQFLLPLIYTLLWRARLTWLSDPQNTYLVSFFFFFHDVIHQYYFSARIHLAVLHLGIWAKIFLH